MKKIIYGILAIFMSMGLALGCVFAVKTSLPTSQVSDSVTDEKTTSNTKTEGYWTDEGNYADSFAGGNGTESNPYQIANAPQLARLAYLTNKGTDISGKFYKLMSDIDTSAHYWIPIGNVPEYDFDGHFSGDGHDIKGLTCKVIDDNYGKYGGTFAYVGLFGNIFTHRNGYYSSVKNFTLSEVNFFVECNIISAIRIGVVAAEAYNVVFENVGVMSGNLSLVIEAPSTNGIYGGLVGVLNCSTLERCFCNLNLQSLTCSNSDSSKAFVCGGLVGQTFWDRGYVTINECYCTSNLEILSGDFTSYIGGLIGRVESLENNIAGKLNLFNCFFFGHMEVYATHEKDTLGRVLSFVGGLIGAVFYARNSIISNCYFNDTLGARIYAACVGGIVGQFSCADISGVGDTSNNIYSCWMGSEIEGNADIKGALIGRTYVPNRECTSLYGAANCWLESKSVGKVVGENVYDLTDWNEDSSTHVKFSDKTLPTKAEFYTSKDYLNNSLFAWNISDDGKSTWLRKRNINDGYPILTWAEKYFPVQSAKVSNAQFFVDGTEQDSPAEIAGISLFSNGIDTQINSENFEAIEVCLTNAKITIQPNAGYALERVDGQQGLAVSETIVDNKQDHNNAGHFAGSDAKWNESELVMDGNIVYNFTSDNPFDFSITSLKFYFVRLPKTISNVEFYWADERDGNLAGTEKKIDKINKVVNFAKANEKSLLDTDFSLKIYQSGKVEFSISPNVGFAFVAMWANNTNIWDNQDAKNIINGVKILGDMTEGFEPSKFNENIITLKLYFKRVVYQVAFNEEKENTTINKCTINMKREDASSANVGSIASAQTTVNVYGLQGLEHQYGYSWKVYTQNKQFVYGFEDVSDQFIRPTGYGDLTFENIVDKLGDSLTNDTDQIVLTMSHEKNTYTITFLDMSETGAGTGEYVSNLTGEVNGGETTVNGSGSQLTFGGTGGADFAVHLPLATSTNSAGIAAKSAGGYYWKAMSLNPAAGSAFNANLLSGGMNSGKLNATYQDVLNSWYGNLFSGALVFGTSENDLNVQREIDMVNFFSVAKFNFVGEVEGVQGYDASDAFTVWGYQGSNTWGNFDDSATPWCNTNVRLALKPDFLRNANAQFIGWFLDENADGIGDKLLSTSNMFEFTFSPTELYSGLLSGKRDSLVGYDEKGFAIGRRVVAKFSSVSRGSSAVYVKGVYNISSANDLIWLSSRVSAGANFEGYLFRQTADINMSGVNFAPIGSSASSAFKGVYDGNFYSIKNLQINLETLSNVGLFGFTDGATIKNVTLAGGSVKGFSNVGAVVGSAKNTTFENVNNLSCVVEASGLNFYDIYGNRLEGENASGENFAGLVGGAENCSFVECSNRAGVRGSGVNNLAGLVGFADGGRIDQCYTEGYKLAFGSAETTNFYDATGPHKTDNDVWMQIGNKWVLKIFYW